MRSPADWPFLLAFPLVEEHELQRVEVGSQDQQVVEVALAEDAHEVVADLGRQRFRLGEHDSKELLGVFGEKLDPLDGAGRFARQPDRLRRQERAVGGVVPELRQERRDGVRRGKLGHVLGGQVEIGRVRHRRYSSASDHGSQPPRLQARPVIHGNFSTTSGFISHQAESKASYASVRPRPLFHPVRRRQQFDIGLERRGPIPR